MPRTRACPSCGQMCLLGGFAFHVKQCGRKMTQVETACPYCDKMYPQMELASHVGACLMNPNRTRTNARDRRNAGRTAINGKGRAGGVGQAANGGTPGQYGTAQQQQQQRRRQPETGGGAGGAGGGLDRIEIMSVQELRSHIAAGGLSHADCFEKSELKARAREAGPVAGGGSKVDCEPAPSREREPMKEFPSDGGGLGLVPCGHCGRSFVPDRIGKHMAICGKQKKRRGFDSAAQRGRGQEIFTRLTPRGAGGAGAGKGSGGGNRHARVDYGLPSEAKLRSKWRQEHREFQNVLRSIRGKAPLRTEYASPGGGGGVKNGEPGGGPPGTSGPSHFVPCPHCSRTFAPMAASRHIPSCGNSHARPKPPPAMRGSIVAAAGGRSRAGWNSGPGGGGSSRASAGRQRQWQPRVGEGGRPLTGGPMVGGRFARFPSGGASGGGGYNTLEQQRMSQTAAASAFAAAGATALYGLHGHPGSVRPASSGGGIAGRDRAPSGGGFRSIGGGRGGGGGGGRGRGGFANGYQMNHGPVRIDPGGGGGFMPMLSSGARRPAPNTKWPSVYQQ
jgi:hypothetical protein